MLLRIFYRRAGEQGRVDPFYPNRFCPAPELAGFRVPGEDCIYTEDGKVLGLGGVEKWWLDAEWARAVTAPPPPPPPPPPPLPVPLPIVPPARARKRTRRKVAR